MNDKANAETRSGLERKRVPAALSVKRENFAKDEVVEN
jgi:hypothetical protein